jgi:hypothetical protein
MGPIKPVSPYRMPVGSRESEWSCIYIYIYMLRPFLTVSTIFRLNFKTVLSVVFLVFHFIYRQLAASNTLYLV